MRRGLDALLSVLLSAPPLAADLPAPTPGPLPSTNPNTLFLRAEGRFNEYLGMAGRELLLEGVQRLVEDANRLEPFFLNLAGGQE